MRVPREAGEERLEVLVQQRVLADLRIEVLELLGRRELAVDEQVRGLQERRVLGELLDGIAAVAQDTSVPVDERDR